MLDIRPLFEPFRVGDLQLPNRIVMAPMTRAFSPNGVPGDDVAAYYARHAANEIGLIVTEGTWIAEEHASNDGKVPRFFGNDALAGWKNVLSRVKASGGHIVPQLWHVGISPKADIAELYGENQAPKEQIGPSGVLKAGQPSGRVMTSEQIDVVAAAYVEAAVTAQSLGFDGVELHGAHGYLLDQFFWHSTNQRTDRYGGDIAGRTRFAAQIIREIRRKTAPGFPIILRYSQWKIVDYGARLANNPCELERFLAPLADAGVDLFHVSQRRFNDAAFEGSNLSLAGWTRKLSGLPTITVGSVTLDKDMFESMVEGRERASAASLEPLLRRFENGEFDLVAVGRALLANPDWVKLVRSNRFDEIRHFDMTRLLTL